MRVALAALCCPKGRSNLDAHAEVLARAAALGCELAVFPEMSLGGSVEPASRPQWLLSLDSEPVRAMVELTGRTGVAALFGLAERCDDGAARISQIYAARGELVGVYHKRHLGEGEEAFALGSEPALFRAGGVHFGVAICAEAGVDFPFDEPAAAGARAIFVCAAPGLYGRRTDDASWQAGHAWWESCGLADAVRHARRTGTWIGIATQAGSTVDEDFPGLAALVAPTGEVVDRLPDWREGLLVVDIPVEPVEIYEP
jgi:predicted amidohydrolase